jgi:hypothetical protein
LIYCPPQSGSYSGFYRRCESVNATAVAMLVACFSESPLC